MEAGLQMAGVDKWWVVIEDLQSVAGRSPDSSRRVMKNVECGLAGLISSQPINIDTKTVLPKATRSSMFNILPLPISSDLPVHIHATFMLSGDRRSIAIDEYGTKSHGSDWNRHILEVALPKLYLTFLDEIGKQVRQRVFEFWPQNEAPKGSCSELLCASFWKELPKSPLRLFPKARPIVESSQRRPAELFDIDKAVFDFLPKDQSDILAPLLLSLGVNLVRHVPTEVAKHLQRYPEVNFIKGKFLRPFFKSERSRECLLTEMAKNSRILDVLYGQLITSVTEIEDLNGCYLLLLANGDLATLELANTNNSQSPKYYVASAEELKLFGFASSCLVTPSIGKRLRMIVDSGKFNLTNLKLSHIDKLLKKRPSVSFPDAASDRWLMDFWAYWDKNIESLPSSPNLEGLGGNIFRATRTGVDMYVTVAEFNKLPAVVEPSIGDHQELCNKVPGLYRFNAKFMPKHLADNEKSFHKDVTIHRFVRALRLLARDVGIETFVKSCLELSDIKVILYL
jgi:sacsin